MSIIRLASPSTEFCSKAEHLPLKKYIRLVTVSGLLEVEVNVMETLMMLSIYCL